MKKRVLIADQDTQTREALARNLAIWGYEVVLASDGAEAWGILQRGDAPKIALFGSNLTGVDHLELCRRVRDMRGDDGFVLVLAEESAEGRATHLAAFEAGADGVLAKPVHMRELRMQLAAGMRGRRLAVSDPPSRFLSLPAGPSCPPSTHDAGDRALVGRVIARKYQIVRLIGKGGMGTVWQGTHLTLGVSVAIKFIKAEYARHELARARFELEARSAARVQTKYAVKILDYGVTEAGIPYLVMEYLEGASLLQYVQEHGPMSFSETLTLVTQAAHALGQLHGLGMIHRDVKPDNILLVADPDAAHGKPARVAKLIDFGVAKIVADTHAGQSTAGSKSLLTQTGIVIGTPNYMPPEQIVGEAEANVGSDLWALATCAFTAITGRIPFEGGTLPEVVRKVCRDALPVPSHVNPAVPVEFDQWFARACSRDARKRFASARDAARALVQAFDDFASASVEMTPSLTSFVAKRSVAPIPVYDYAAAARPTVRPMRVRMYEIEAPTLGAVG